MSIISDSYMNLILPEDISTRIRDFITGGRDFPYIEENELMCLLFVYGRDHRVKTETEVNETLDLVERTVANITKEIEYYNNSKARFNTEFIKSKYIRRELQIVQEQHTSKLQIWNDPTVLTDSFARHVSFHRQEYFFQVFGPLEESELLTELRGDLMNRIVMVGFNRRDQSFVPFKHSLVPVYIWFRDRLKFKA
jgi:hypothetical protein